MTASGPGGAKVAFADRAGGPPSDGWTTPADSGFESGSSKAPAEPDPNAAGWSASRRRALIGFVVAGIAGVSVLVWALATAPHLDAMWRANEQGQIELASSDDPLLRPFEDKVLLGVTVPGAPILLLDARILSQSARWMIEDANRAALESQSARLAEALRHDALTLNFADGGNVPLRPGPRGVLSLPSMFWLLCAFGFALYVVAATTLLAKPAPRNRAYAVMAWCQAVNLLMIAVEATLDLGLPEPFARIDMPLRTAMDLATAAAMVTSVGLQPRRIPGSQAIAVAVAVGIIALAAALAAGLPNAWWWIQTCIAACGLAAIGLLSLSYRVELNPFTLVLRRFGVLALSTWILLTVALASAHSLRRLPHSAADLGSMVWYVFLGSLLMLTPFLARTHTALREFALLTAISTVATSLHLLFVAIGSFSPFASLTFSLFISLAVYSGARQWLMNHLLGSSRLTPEHLFEQLYRVAREVEAHPERTPALLTRLIGDLFEPLDIERVDKHTNRTRVATDGSSLLVPLPLLGDFDESPGSVLMRFAQRGRRLFSAEDARLTDRIVEQFRRAVNFDRAVEQGRHEERLRLAQDLHDDIGARLLTLMYQARSPEVEEYVRHTLQDLKTLTRGLAASNHRLSHAAAEWKSDLTHRLSVAHIEVDWAFAYDDDILLTVGHWSALTRVLRELVSNSIAHARATRMHVDFRLEGDRVELIVSDDGIGREPATWQHGLGLGGVRKRVKQLGGSVEWREASPRGITCRVVVRELSSRG